MGQSLAAPTPMFLLERARTSLRLCLLPPPRLLQRCLHLLVSMPRGPMSPRYPLMLQMVQPSPIPTRLHLHRLLLRLRPHPHPRRYFILSGSISALLKSTISWLQPPADALPAFREFVTHEKQRLTQKRQALVKSERDKRMTDLLKFSQNFKVIISCWFH